MTIKRVFDIYFSSMVILFLFPIYVAISLIVFFNLGTPIFYNAIRVGKNNKNFKIYKFRTMQANSNVPKNKIMNFLRKTNLDELPQFLNVFLGDMSVVGPRPHDLDEDILFEEKIKNYKLRKEVLPGITGLSAIMGNRGGSSIEFITQRVRFDLEYIDKQSLYFDIIIILKTIKTIFKPNH